MKNNIDPAVLARAKAIAEKWAARTAELMRNTEDVPEPVCPTCGRVIYIGASKLCQKSSCGLKNRVA